MPNNLCGHQKGLPSGDGPPSLPQPPVGVLAPFPYPRLRGDVLCPRVHTVWKMYAFWHKVQRWVTNCFTCSTPTNILAIEACPPRLELLLLYKTCLASLRVLCSPPDIKLASARLLPSVQTLFIYGYDQDHPVLLARNVHDLLPLKWVQVRPPLINLSHLPLEAIPHMMLFLLGPDGLAPFPVTS